MERNVKKLINSRILTNIKYILTIFLFGELFFYVLSIVYDKKLYYFWLVLVSVLAVYFIYYSFIFLVKIAKRKRYDIILSIIIALFLLIYPRFNIVQEFIENFPNTIQVLSSYILTIWSVLALMIFGLYYYFLKKETGEKKPKEPYFLSDEPIQDKEGEEEDVFGFEDDAKNFADQVLNNESSNSIVFGIDAPWGSGKSSYLYFCKQYWKEYNDKNKDKNKDSLIIFEFNPLRFGKSSDVFEMFTKELLKKIDENYFNPEASSEFKKYIKLISSINFGPFGISLPFSNNTNSEEAFKNLEEYLKNFNKKIIVLIDDLDRIPLEKVKTVIDIVKKSFVLPNVTYVLCYDTENINSFDVNLKETETKNVIESEDDNIPKSTNSNNINSDGTKKEKDTITISREKIDNLKIAEYFEKVVNVKKTLVCSRESLKNYLVHEINSGEHKCVTKKSTENVEQAIDKIFDFSTFDEYINYVGDLRKIKRFLNIFRMQIVNKLDLINSDIEFADLCHLVLIYINYPRIFREIYASETDGGKEIFSLVSSYNPKNKRTEYINSEKYKQYSKNLTKEKRYLLDKVFHQKRFDVDSIEEKVMRTFAAFNGTGGTQRNLERHLVLITRKERSDLKKEAYNFHSEKVKDFIGGKKIIEEIFKSKEYAFSKENNAEKYRLMFFRILIENIDKIKYEKAQEVIDYILNDIENYSVARNDKIDIKLRRNLIYFLLAILNDKGWEDGVNNTGENVVKIAERVFGDKEFENRGILDKLPSNKGILGIYDMLEFRLYCSHDRSNHYYNLFSALGYRENKKAKTNGLVRDLAVQQMREISQKCFEIIKTAYIENSLNIFDEIKNISQESFYGKSYEYIKGKIGNIQENFEREKNAMISFMIYQVANKNIDFGVGCGYYDEDKSENKNGIRKTFNEYLFDVCFSMDIKKENCVYFVDYLLNHLKREQDYSSDISKYVPAFENFTITLDAKMLVDYWVENGEEIKKYFIGKNKTIYTYNYTAFYNEDLGDLFKVLDEEIPGKQIRELIEIVKNYKNIKLISN